MTGLGAAPSPAADSMLALEIVARIEKRYRIRIPEESFSRLTSLNEVVNMVAEIMQPVNS